MISFGAKRIHPNEDSVRDQVTCDAEPRRVFTIDVGVQIEQIPAPLFPEATRVQPQDQTQPQAWTTTALSNLAGRHVASAKLREHEAASPTLPGFSAGIKRPRAVTVQFLNEAGKVEERDFVGLWATSMQHQIDHLNGRMFFDNLSKVKRDMLLRKARKVAQ